MQDINDWTRRSASIAGLACLVHTLSVAPARAEEANSLGPSVQMHGFVSQGYIKTTENNYLAKTKNAGSFEFSEAGLNFTMPLSDELRVGAQLFARDLGPIGNYSAKFDWYYLDYRFWDWLGLRAGRTKLPFGLYNETSDIDAARVAVLLPQSIYPVRNRDFLLAQSGVELYGFVPIGMAGELEYRAYGGTVFLDASASQTVSDFTVPYVVGGRLMWFTPLDGLQIGGSAQALRLEGDVELGPETIEPLQMAGQLPADFDGTASFAIPALLWVASIEYTFQDLLFATEYTRWHVEAESSVTSLVQDPETVTEGFYAMLSYSVASWFTPGVYYSVTFPDVEERVGIDAYQHDVAATFRYDLNAHWILKLEGHYMRGTAALSPSLNDGAAPSDLAGDWGVALVKTTAYF